MPSIAAMAPKGFVRTIRAGDAKKLYAEHAVPIKSLRDFIRWLSIGAGLYLLDCFVATLEHEAPDVPWIARGVRAAYLFFGTCGWLLAPLIFAIKERIDTQPRG